MFAYLCLSIYLSIHPSIDLYISLCIYLFIYLSVCLSLKQKVYFIFLHLLTGLFCRCINTGVKAESLHGLWHILLQNRAEEVFFRSVLKKTSWTSP